MKEFFLILFGFLLGRIPEWYNRKRRLKTHWGALSAEMDLCKEQAETLLRDKVASPLYRLPLIAYQVSFPVLLADGAALKSEVMAISRFFNQVQEINRGLDNAAEMLKSGEIEKLKDEFNRNCLKAKELIESKENKLSLYLIAKNIIDNKISAKWWHTLQSSIGKGGK